MPDPDRMAIGELWRSVNLQIHDRFRHAFRDLNLSPMALILLRNIEHEPGLTISELARRAGTGKSHVSKLVDQLVAQGFLEKRTDPADQRLIRLFLTHTAKESKSHMEGRAQQLWAEVMDQVPAEQVAEVEKGLRILLVALERSDRY